jgi:hypothetical protein
MRLGSVRERTGLSPAPSWSVLERRSVSSSEVRAGRIVRRPGPGGRHRQDHGREALATFIPVVHAVDRITIEHTPKRVLFNDQVGVSGVDCDVLVEFRDVAGAKGVLVIETKFVEPEFSVCGFRKKGAKRPCPLTIKIVGEDGAACGYSKKGYLYWKRALEEGTLVIDRVHRAAGGCPFDGPAWQLWVNHTLAHAEAARREARYAYFAVCAPSDNKALRARRAGDIVTSGHRMEAMICDLVESVRLESGQGSCTGDVAPGLQHCPERGLGRAVQLGH